MQHAGITKQIAKSPEEFDLLDDPCKRKTHQNCWEVMKASWSQQDNVRSVVCSQHRYFQHAGLPRIVCSGQLRHLRHQAPMDLKKDAKQHASVTGVSPQQRLVSPTTAVPALSLLL